MVNVYSRDRKHFVPLNTIDAIQLDEAGPGAGSTPEAGVTVSADTRADCGR
jgi:hypothetical protein